MKKEITLPSTTKKKFFRQSLRFMAPITKLQDKESDVLAELLYYHNEHLALPEEVKWKMVFDSETKAKIREDLKMGSAHFANIISSLRKKAIITANNQIARNYIITLDNSSSFELIFRFPIS